MSQVAFVADSHRIDPIACRDEVRAATQLHHERLHLHSGFAAVKDGTIGLASYRALLARLYGFYQPFERALGEDCTRTQWLGQDLGWLGVDTAALDQIRRCADIPCLGSLARRLGALYMAEGSALGGRQLCRSLDHLLGAATLDGRRFFAGRGAETGRVWANFLTRLAAAGEKPADRAAMVGAATETFEVFEIWLKDWETSI